MNEMPDVMMPSARSPGTTRLSGQLSAHCWISASFWRSRRCAARAYAGIMTRERMSRSNRAGRRRAAGAARLDQRVDCGRPAWSLAAARASSSARTSQRREHEIVRFLGIRRLEHRHAGRDRVAPVVLLVLAGGHAGIVGGDDHQPAGDSGVGGGEERVRGDVQADVFHGGQGARAPEGGAERHFERDLFVGRPLRRGRPSSEKRSRISVEGVPGYPAPSATPACRAASAIASSPLRSCRCIEDMRSGMVWSLMRPSSSIHPPRNTHKLAMSRRKLFSPHPGIIMTWPHCNYHHVYFL